MSIIHRSIFLENPFSAHRRAPTTPSRSHRITALKDAFLNPRQSPKIPSLPAWRPSSITTIIHRRIMVPRTQPVTFETLPVEVRLQIYKHIINSVVSSSARRSDSLIATLRSSFFRNLRSTRNHELAIMRVSRKIHVEFRDALWSNIDLTVELTKQFYLENDFYDVQIHNSVRKLRTPLPLGPLFPDVPIKNLIIKIDINPCFANESGMSLYHLRGLAPQDIPVLNCEVFKRKVTTLVSMLRMVPKIHRMHVHFCDLRKYGEYQGLKYLLKKHPMAAFETIDDILEIFEGQGFEGEEREFEIGKEWEAFVEGLARPLAFSRVEK